MLQPPRDRKTPVIAKIVANQTRPSSMKLRIHLLAGRQLKAMDRGGTSDPYVRMRLADKEWSSSVVKKTCDPVWKEEDMVDFLVFDRGRIVEDGPPAALASDETSEFAKHLAAAEASHE